MDDAPSLPAILAEGRHWLVIDKPAGLAVHPGPRTPDSLEALLPGYAPGRPAPRAVHRLDRDTSGCLLLARRPAAHRRLAAAFADRAVDKLYWAVVTPAPSGESGRIDAPLAKHSSAQAGWRMRIDPAGAPAVTHWEVLARRGQSALVAFRPETGRTHQIRAHATCLAPGASIAGDPVYGTSAGRGDGLLLHARALRFPDPDPGARGDVRVMAPLPARFGRAGFTSEADEAAVTGPGQVP